MIHPQWACRDSMLLFVDRRWSWSCGGRAGGWARLARRCPCSRLRGGLWTRERCATRWGSSSGRERCALAPWTLPPSTSALVSFSLTSIRPMNPLAGAFATCAFLLEAQGIRLAHTFNTPFAVLCTASHSAVHCRRKAQVAVLAGYRAMTHMLFHDQRTSLEAAPRIGHGLMYP